MDNQGTPSYPSLLTSLPYISHFIYTENDDMEGKGKTDRATHCVVSFQSSLLISKSKVESVGRMCANQDMK